MLFRSIPLISFRNRPDGHDLHWSCIPFNTFVICPVGADDTCHVRAVTRIRAFHFVIAIVSLQGIVIIVLNQVSGVKIKIIMVLHLVTERSEEHTSELQSLMRISYAVFCLKKKTYSNTHTRNVQK